MPPRSRREEDGAVVDGGAGDEGLTDCWNWNGELERDGCLRDANGSCADRRFDCCDCCESCEDMDAVFEGKAGDFGDCVLPRVPNGS